MSRLDRDKDGLDESEVTGERDTRSATGIEINTRQAREHSPESEMSGLLGTLVSERYQVNRLLGVGGMGAVFEAEHVHMKKLVALKVLHPRLLINPEVVARFEREAVAAGRLQHPGIVGATDFGRLKDGSFYLALEYVDGRSLADVLNHEGAMDPERAVHVAIQVNSALCAAHSAGIVHRDLKPDNVMLVRTGDDEDFVKVLDFGIAKLTTGAGQKEGLTRAGLVFGTPEYMSPEQAMGHEADARSDLYGVGMLLYEMLAGKSPFHHDDVTAMLTAQITETPPLLPESVPEGLARLVYCLLEKSPENRPGSAEELAEDFVLLAEKMEWQLPIPRTSAGTRLELPGFAGIARRPLGARALDSVRSFSMAPVSVGRKRIPRWIPLVALLGGAALGIVATLYGRQGSAPSRAPTEVSAPVDAEERLLARVRSGDRDAISELRKRVAAEQEELERSGVLLPPSPGPSGQPQPNELPSHEGGHERAPEAAAENATEQQRVLRQAARYLALGRGYSVIKHSPAALKMYEHAVMLDPHLADEPELLMDVRTALGAHDAVEEGLDFAMARLGAHGADLVYDVYLDHLGEAGMTAVVARAMKMVKSKELFDQASPSLQVALRLGEARVCADYRAILGDAAAHADDRSLLKLRALTTRRGCGTFGNKDCFVCLRQGNVPLDEAVRRAATHASPVFLTPKEAAAEDRSPAP